MEDEDLRLPAGEQVDRDVAWEPARGAGGGGLGIVAEKVGATLRFGREGEPPLPVAEADSSPVRVEDVKPVAGRAEQAESPRQVAVGDPTLRDGPYEHEQLRGTFSRSRAAGRSCTGSG